MSKNEMTVQIWTQPGISPRLSCAQKSSCLNTLLNTFLGTRKTKESSFCSKSCKSIAKSTQTVKFECLMLELLGGFELPTSSLPTLPDKVFLSLPYHNLSQFILCFQCSPVFFHLCPFVSCCTLSYSLKA